jgi:hypothetical protein
VLLHHGKEYDAAAIAGIAHGLATGRTLTPADIPGGSAGASKHLVRLGFDIRDDSPPAPQRVPGTRSTTPRTPRATTTRATTSRPRVAASDRVDKLCPTCFLALPATGICDNCA